MKVHRPPRVRSGWRRKLGFEVDANLGKWGQKNNFSQRQWGKNNFTQFFLGKWGKKQLHPKKLCKLVKTKLFHLKKRGKTIFFLFISDKPLKVLKCPHSFHKRVKHYQMTPVLCFHGRKWFPLKCWLNNSRKVFLWGNKMLHTTVSHHIWKNIQRKMMGVAPWCSTIGELGWTTGYLGMVGCRARC